VCCTAPAAGRSATPYATACSPLPRAEELRYVSNGPAQALARATTSLVGLVVHDVAVPYFSAIAAGAMRTARAHRLMPVWVELVVRDSTGPA